MPLTPHAASFHSLAKTGHKLVVRLTALGQALERETKRLAKRGRLLGHSPVKLQCSKMQGFVAKMQGKRISSAGETFLG